MNIRWRLGRIGTMLVTLNYTWALLGALGLWLMATRWLPRYADGVDTRALWLLAALTGLMFLGCVLLAEQVRTAVTGGFSRRWPRTVQLLPFGAAAAYPLQGLPPARATLAAAAGPAVLGLLGLLCYALARLGSGTLFPWAVGGALRALVLLNLGAALLNLLPGLPLAGGWLLLALMRGYNGSTTGGFGITRGLGFLFAMALAAAGVVFVLQGQHLSAGLTLLALAWTLREGSLVVEERAATRRMLEQVTATDLMVRPANAVRADDNLAAVMWRQGHSAKDTVLPVIEPDGRFAGLLPLAVTDDLLQGTWATTPVRDLMLPAAKLPMVTPRTPLAAVLAAFGREAIALPATTQATAEGDEPLATSCIPVLERGTLLGIIAWPRVEAYEQMAAGAGIQEASPLEPVRAPAPPRARWLALAGAALVVALLLVTLGTSGSQNGPVVAAPLGGGPISFGTPAPADGAIVGRGQVQVSIPIQGITTAAKVTMTFDGAPLTTALAPGDNSATVATAQASAQLLGTHTVAVQVTAGDQTVSHTWHFRVVAGAPTGPK